MYRLSLLPRKVLITTDEVIAQAATDTNPQVSQLLHAIHIAEERFIKPAICKDLYYDFRAQKNVDVTEVNKDYLEDLINVGNTSEPVVLQVGDIVNAIELVTNTWYKQLWYEHLWKIIAECVVYTASPTNFSRFAAAGEMENNPKVISNEGQGAATVDLKKMQWKMDKMLMDRIDPLLAAMHDWMYDNRSQFVYYNCKKFHHHDDTNSGISTLRKSGWIKVYDDHRDKCCDEWN